VCTSKLRQTVTPQKRKDSKKEKKNSEGTSRGVLQFAKVVGEKAKRGDSKGGKRASKRNLKAFLAVMQRHDKRSGTEPMGGGF